MKNQEPKWQSACIVGACPEILKSKNGIKLRNSISPKNIVEFSHEEWEEFRTALAENRF